MKSEALTEEAPNRTVTPDFQMFDCLIVLAKRRRFIFWFTGAAAVLAIIVALLLPNRYTAETLVMPPAQNSSLGSALLGQFAGSGSLAAIAGAGLGIRNPADMYVSLFRSRTVEEEVIRQFGLMARYRDKKMADTRRDFEDHSTVVLGVKDGLIRVTITDRDPKLAADIANAYVDDFRKLSEHLAITEASQRRMFFQQQLVEANKNLATSEEALKHTEQSTGVLQIDSQARSLIESAAGLRGQIAAKEVQLQAMKSYATEDNPDMIVAAQELAALKAQLAKLGGSSELSSSDIIVPKGNLPGAGMEYLRKLRDVKYYSTVAELIARQLEVAKLDEAREGAIVQVADVAVPPDRKSSPHRIVIVVLMTLLAFACASLCVLASARWKQQMLRDPEKNRKMQVLRGLLSRRHS